MRLPNESNFGILENLNTIVLLGRNGDIINLLPLAHKFGECNWVVSAEFENLFDGVSYVNPVPYLRGPNHFVEATEFAKKAKYPNIIPAQVYTNPDKRRLTPAYNIESWRLAGFGEEWERRRPLVFDKRDAQREAKLIWKWAYDADSSASRPVVLVATKSVSSPFYRIEELLKKLRMLDAHIVDMRHVKADRVYDMIGLFDKVACLVTVDTVHLHLARASYCPTVALINDGWCGSSCPPQAEWVHRYKDCDTDKVVEDVQKVLDRYNYNPSIAMAVDLHEEHKAQETWPSVPAKSIYLRSSQTQLNDDRSLPFFRDVLQQALRLETGELIVWTNSDVGFSSTGLRQIKDHAQKYNFGCVRRDTNHIGRECFWFRRSWLEKNISDMPDVVLAAPKCDLVIAKWLRKFYGIVGTLDSMNYDYPPVDLPPGIVYHEHHASSWLNYQDSPSAKWNEELWRKI